VSVEAISWALNLAPVPADRSGQPSSACKFASPVITAISGSVAAKRTSVLPELWFVILGGALVRTLLPGAKRASRALR